ncbi:tRNA (adenosine(37)-N6)-threonylcarbamoyltransferase complex dimerization subunit type 1 TsaB [Guyparkeria halophila]|uniref:tRNA threonylcarbamoyladenosine biosynthesis protein TsaB n=1 Tax=Guyparkeria halophila TaxID=47960 RepID=A0ABZ0YVV2_9GAMM|nr:tRNA (adenosine(37)-N6)-threonylcarbamoyltransferase complex dimerization subunit type 1 TsaB [Guyparkeria halophila]WQH15499.1 tRNA (adenosine(37)-N6)-threonylcarbamoyltransferase complex dimerization subunit type 1 TsaB [Guyparkeria halophila]
MVALPGRRLADCLHHPGVSVNILYLDSSTEACTAGVLAGDRVVTGFEVAPRGHAEKLLPMAEGLLEEAQIEFEDLDLIGFGRGPGSFTGVRIATAMAQGIAIARDLPMVGISSLACLAAGAFRRLEESGEYTGDVEVQVAIDARMGEIYRAVYRLGDSGDLITLVEEAVTEPTFPAAKENRVVACGTGFGRYPKLGEGPAAIRVEPEALPHARDALDLIRRLPENERISPDAAVPSYLRDKVAGR